ncbi:MAG: preprotein translocase subunit YajC [Burkholderiaceae bacterium]
MFISNAYAQSGGAAGGGLYQLLPFILMFVVFYFLLIRPQMKRAKELKAMNEALKKGDEVVTNGGIAGKITKVTQDWVILEVADKVEMKIQKAAVATLLPNGTIKQL